MSTILSTSLATPRLPSSASTASNLDAAGKPEQGRLHSLATARSFDVDTAREKTEELEGVFLSRLVATMLDSVELMPGMNQGAGARAAEDFQKSMMAEKVGATMAQAGGIGLSADVLDQLIRIQSAQS